MMEAVIDNELNSLASSSPHRDPSWGRGAAPSTRLQPTNSNNDKCQEDAQADQSLSAEPNARTLKAHGPQTVSRHEHVYQYRGLLALVFLILACVIVFVTLTKMHKSQKSAERDASGVNQLGSSSMQSSVVHISGSNLSARPANFSATPASISVAYVETSGPISQPSTSHVSVRVDDAPHRTSSNTTSTTRVSVTSDGTPHQKRVSTTLENSSTFQNVGVAPFLRGARVVRSSQKNNVPWYACVTYAVAILTGVTWVALAVEQCRAQAA